MGIKGNTWVYMGTHEYKGVYIKGYTWVHMGTKGYTWV